MIKGWIEASIAAVALLSAGAAYAEDIVVPIDMAAPVRLSQPAEGVAVGNPAIAGVSVQNDTLLFVTGRSYGTTNLVIIGQNGRTLYNGRITVTPNNSGAVTLTRGTQTESYNCSPVCRASPDIGDSPETFQGVTEQINARASNASGR